MSTKNEIWMDDEAGIYLFEEALMVGESPAYIQVGRDRFKIEIEFDGPLYQATIEVPAESMDQVALAWIKRRGLSDGV